MGPPAILVMGAGAVGCHLGGLLAAAGCDVHLVARARVLDGIRAHGLRCTDLEGGDRHVGAARLRLHEAPPAAFAAQAPPSLTLLCVKSGATAEAAALLGACLPRGSLVVSMQNGIGNADRARVAAPGLELRAGMVPFNIAEVGPGHYHRGTSGVLCMQGSSAEPALAQLARDLQSQGLGLKLMADLLPLQWAKLLLNLNNAVNALSGLPLHAELLERGYRRCLADLQDEALGLLEAAGTPLARLTPLPPRRVTQVLRLPTPLFRVLASAMLKIDAQARSSMADDLRLGRVTEIDALCGEVVRLAGRIGRRAPLNARMVELVGDWPRRGRPYAPEELMAALHGR